MWYLILLFAGATFVASMFSNSRHQRPHLGQQGKRKRRWDNSSLCNMIYWYDACPPLHNMSQKIISTLETFGLAGNNALLGNRRMRIILQIPPRFTSCKRNHYFVWPDKCNNILYKNFIWSNHVPRWRKSAHQKGNIMIIKYSC